MTPATAVPPPDGEPPTPAELLKGLRGLAQVAVQTGWKATAWTAQATINSAGYVVDRTLAGESAATIMQDAAHDLRAAAWHALGLMGSSDPRAAPTVTRHEREITAVDLRKRGAELLRRSNDVHITDDTHPAFARILSEITPDEARILRFLYLEGPQPSIDVRTSRPLGIGSELVAAGLNMIGEHAGCRHVDLIGQYLTNLARLGLIEMSEEQVSNPQRYQVVEAQPKVVEAMKHAGRLPKAVHRSVHLNEFGRTFCLTCLPLGDAPNPSAPAIVPARSEGNRPKPG